MLEQIAYEVQRVSEERQTNYFTVGDLESLSASALYTGHLPKAGPGGFALTPVGERVDIADIPMYGTISNPIVFPEDIPTVKAPLYGISSKLFMEGIEKSAIPVLRYDSADKDHTAGHLHVRDFSALPNMSESEAVDSFVSLWLKSRKE